MKKTLIKILSLVIAITAVMSFSVGCSDSPKSDFSFAELSNNLGYELTGYTGESTQVEVPSTYNGKNVVKIASRAFNNATITSVTIPSSVQTIDSMAFNGCSALTSVTLNEGLEIIGSSAFNSCINLTSIVIPDSVMQIGDDAFRSCKTLANVTMGSGVISIGGYAFGECWELLGVDLPNGLETLGDSVFYECRLITNIVIPMSVTVLGDSMFRYCDSLENVYCVAQSQPSGWSNSWRAGSDVSSYNVVWGYMPD